MNEGEEKNLASRIAELLRTSEQEINSYVTEVISNVNLKGTKAVSHCYFLTLDGNGRPKTKEFARFIAKYIVDYAIPRKELYDAQAYDLKHNTRVKATELVKKAEGLFTSLEKTGEGGEMILYIFVQEFLKFPQLICKMPLKTNKELHINGADGIHVSVDKNTKGEDILSLYWGESKLYKNINKAISDCIDSLKNFILSDGGQDAPEERDLQLITDNLDLLDEKLEKVMIRYLDKDDPLHNQVNYKGVCLIGFDYNKYPSTANAETTEQVKEKIKKEVDNWLEKVINQISKHANLDTFDIHVFLLPFPSVNEFRKSFLKEIGITR
jgi:hypothetical protein